MQQSANEPTNPKIRIDKFFVSIGFFDSRLCGATAAAVVFLLSGRKDGEVVRIKRFGENGLKLGVDGTDVG